MNIRKIAATLAVAAVAFVAFAGTSSAARNHGEPPMLPVSVVNDQTNTNIEVFVELISDNPEDNVVVSCEAQPRIRQELFQKRSGEQCHALLSYRLGGTLHQIEVNEVLREAKHIRLSEFVAQRVDNYPYGG